MDILSIKGNNNMKRREKKFNVYNNIYYEQTNDVHLGFSAPSNTNKVNSKLKGEMTLKWVTSLF